jgi:hypothetical protein
VILCLTQQVLFVSALIGSGRPVGTAATTIEGIRNWLNAFKKVEGHYPGVRYGSVQRFRTELVFLLNGNDL